VSGVLHGLCEAIWLWRDRMEVLEVLEVLKVVGGDGFPFPGNLMVPSHDLVSNQGHFLSAEGCR
jgi:hypothetical protein